MYPIDPNIQELLDSSKPTDFPGIYENHQLILNPSLPFLFTVIGPTGSGQTTFLTALSNAGFGRIKTATTRSIRPDTDKPNAYIWLQETKSEAESIKEFEDRVREKYNLIESNTHAGQVYGAPKEALLEALKTNKAVILQSENNGVQALRTKLEGIANLVVFFSLPDNMDQIRQRIANTRNEIEERIEIAKQQIADSEAVADFYIHNTENPTYCGKGNDPLECMKEGLVKFCENLMRK